MGLCAQLSGNLLSLFAIPFYLTSLGSEQYAIVLFAVVIQGWILLIDIGLSTAIAREVSDLYSRKNFDKISQLFFAGLVAFSYGAIALLCVIGLFCSINTIQLATHRLIPGDPSNFVLALIFAIAVMRLLEAYVRGYFQGIGNFYIFFGSIILANIFRVVFPISALTYLSGSLEIFFGAQLAASVLICLFLIIDFIRKLRLQTSDGKFSSKISLLIIQPVIKTAIPLICAAIIVTVGTQFDRIYIASFIPSIQYTEVMLAITVASLIPQISQFLSQIYLPVATRNNVINDALASFQAYKYFNHLSFALSVSVAAFFFNFGESLLQFWLGERITTERLFEILQLLLVPFLLSSLINIPAQLPIVRQRSWILLKLNMMLSVISVILTLLLVPSFGGKAIALNLFISQTLGFIFLAVYAGTIFGFRKLTLFYVYELSIVGGAIFLFFYLLKVISIQ